MPTIAIARGGLFSDLPDLLSAKIMERFIPGRTRDGRDDAADRGGHRGRGPLAATRLPPALGPEENDDARSESFNEGKYLVYVNKKLSTLATASHIFYKYCLDL